MEGNFTAVNFEFAKYGTDIEVPIISVFALKIQEWKPVQSFHEYVSYDGEVSSAVTTDTGITSNLLKEKGISLLEVIDKLQKFISGDLVVEFNLPYVMPELEKHMPGFVLNNNFLDMFYIMSRDFHPPYGLAKVCAANGIVIGNGGPGGDAITLLNFTKFCKRRIDITEDINTTVVYNKPKYLFNNSLNKFKVHTLYRTTSPGNESKPRQSVKRTAEMRIFP